MIGSVGWIRVSGPVNTNLPKCPWGFMETMSLWFGFYHNNSFLAKEHFQFISNLIKISQKVEGVKDKRTPLESASEAGRGGKPARTILNPDI